MVEWPYVAGDQGAMRYSPLADLNADTVKRLELAWQWKAPDRPMPEFKTTPGSFSSTPLMINNVVYVTTNYNRLVALDADTGAFKRASSFSTAAIKPCCAACAPTAISRKRCR